MGYTFASATVLLLLITDPLGNIPIFANALKGVAPERRTRVIVREVLIAFALLLVPDSAYAKDIYRWTDDSGDTHYGDRVPQQYKSVARKLVPGAGVLVVK